MSLSDAVRDDRFLAAWENLFSVTEFPHPSLHPDCLKAWFLTDSDDSASQTPVIVPSWKNGQLQHVGVLERWHQAPILLPGGFSWPVSNVRLYGKGLLGTAAGLHAEASDWFDAAASCLRKSHSGALLLEAADTRAALVKQTFNTPQFLAVHSNTPQPRWRMKLPDSVDAYWSDQFRGKTRSTLRRKRKKLGGYRISVASAPHQVADFLVNACEVSRDTWQTKQLGLRVKNSLQEQRVFTAMAERGWFRGYLMELENRPIAFVINTTIHGYVNYEETGFLDTYQDRSPGTVLVSEMIDDLIRDGGFHTLDFGKGHAQYKQLFSNDESTSEDLWLLPSGISGSMTEKLMRASDATSSLLRTALQKTGTEPFIRRLLGK